MLGGEASYQPAPVGAGPSPEWVSQVGDAAPLRLWSILQEAGGEAHVEEPFWAWGPSATAASSWDKPL